jgi:hypothetical protein
MSEQFQGGFIVGGGVWSVVITRSVMTTLPNLEACTTHTQAHTLNYPRRSLRSGGQFKNIDAQFPCRGDIRDAAIAIAHCPV